MSLLETEKRKEERGKLGCILIDRLIKKFGRFVKSAPKLSNVM